MSYAITANQVLDGFSTSASNDDIHAYITLMADADACLEANSVSQTVGKQLKILGVRHLASVANDRGNVVEEQAVSGARRRYSDRAGGETSYMQALRSIDRYQCVLRLLNNNARVQLRSVGRFSSNLTS